jgi:hypothetical protein
MILPSSISLSTRQRWISASGWSAVAEGLGVRALLRRFVSRAPIYAGTGLRTGPARESGGAPPHSKALRATEAPSAAGPFHFITASLPSKMCSVFALKLHSDCP